MTPGREGDQVDYRVLGTQDRLGRVIVKDHPRLGAQRLAALAFRHAVQISLGVSRGWSSVIGSR